MHGNIRAKVSEEVYVRDDSCTQKYMRPTAQALLYNTHSAGEQYAMISVCECIDNVMEVILSDNVVTTT